MQTKTTKDSARFNRHPGISCIIELGLLTVIQLTVEPVPKAGSGLKLTVQLTAE